MKLSERLYATALPIWQHYLTHPFICEMADGTLPPEKFRCYMLQDYLYLRDYVKIFAVIIPKSDDLEEIQFLCREMSDTVQETVRVHLPYMKQLGITDREIRETVPHMDSLSYTHYMLWEAQSGDMLTGLVSLLNCSWSYAYLAENITLLYPTAARGRDYGSWFAGYTCEEYRRINQDLIDRIDTLAEGISEEKADKLCQIFLNCARFDLRFWDMVYRLAEP